MQEDRIVHSFQKNPEEEIRFTLREYKERHYLDLRLWYQPSNGGDYFPTKKGITFALEFLPELKKGLEKTGKISAELALQPTANSVK